MKSDAKRQAEYQARQVRKGKARLNCWIDTSTKQAIGELSEQHGKTVPEVIELGIAAASSLFAGRLTVSRAATKPPTRAIIRQAPQERPQARDQAAGNTNAPAPTENPPVTPLCEPEQPMVDDADARIRACAFAVEP